MKQFTFTVYSKSSDGYMDVITFDLFAFDFAGAWDKFNKLSIAGTVEKVNCRMAK